MLTLPVDVLHADDKARARFVKVLHQLQVVSGSVDDPQQATRSNIP
ncbi:MAG: hypothetical protein M3511_07420 [Deinococcota bacterium]|nr:hypothetical protein [Deinococcota bacterium]